MIPQVKRQFKTFVGVDLGGGRGKNTAVALLTRNGKRGTVTLASLRDGEGSPWYDEPLTRLVMDLGEDALLSVDAPLTLPACIRCALENCPGTDRCSDPAVRWFVDHPVERANGGQRSTSRKPTVTPYTQRVSEVLLHRGTGIHPREALGQSVGPVTARAHHLMLRWNSKWRLLENLIEVYARATVHLLLGKKRAESYRKRAWVWEARATILEELDQWIDFDIWREPVLRNTQVFEAVISALTGFLYAREGWTVPDGFSEVAEVDGWIWTPPGPEGGSGG